MFSSASPTSQFQVKSRAIGVFVTPIWGIFRVGFVNYELNYTVGACYIGLDVGNAIRTARNWHTYKSKIK
jgi:hypothetical protein